MKPTSRTPPCYFIHIQSYHLKCPQITEALQVQAMLVMTNAYCQFSFLTFQHFLFSTPLYFFPFFFFTDLNGPEAVCNRPKARTRMYMGTTAPKPYCLQRWESQQDLNAPACINSPGEEFKTPSEVAFTSNLCA